MSDPTSTHELERAGARPVDHERRGHGAATDPASVWAFARALRRRQAVARGEHPEGFDLDDPAELARERARRGP